MKTKIIYLALLSSLFAACGQESSSSDLQNRDRSRGHHDQTKYKMACNILVYQVGQEFTRRVDVTVESKKTYKDLQALYSDAAELRNTVVAADQQCTAQGNGVINTAACGRIQSVTTANFNTFFSIDIFNVTKGQYRCYAK